jgi:hypothetical protein
MARENSGPRKLWSEAALWTQSWFATANAKSFEADCATHAGQHFHHGPLAEIDAIKQLEAEIQALLADVTE